MFELVLHPTASRGCEGLTTSPSLTYTARTVPATVVTMSFCIFIASSTATTSPSLTGSPGPTGILTMRPCIGAMTVPSPVLGGGATAGAADPAAGMTVIPAPLTRTLKTSPSTSTSNSAVCGAAGAAGLVAAAGAGAGGGSAAGVLTMAGRLFPAAAGAGSRR